MGVFYFIDGCLFFYFYFNWVVPKDDTNLLYFPNQWEFPSIFNIRYRYKNNLGYANQVN